MFLGQFCKVCPTFEFLVDCLGLIFLINQDVTCLDLPEVRFVITIVLFNLILTQLFANDLVDRRINQDVAFCLFNLGLNTFVLVQSEA